VDSLPFVDGELDFAYSLGALHHVPNIRGALREVARTLRPGGHFFVYLYYAFDNRPPWFRIIWRITDLVRRQVSHLPRTPRFLVCEAIAAIIYWPLARLAALFRRLKLPTKNFPLVYYSDKSFYVMRTDALDRFGTSLEKRYTQNEIASLLSDAGFEKISFSDHEPYWRTLAFKADDTLNRIDKVSSE
jgi:ubiquinone/menaquinone biosynthesis C-methylase UbiE